MIYYAGIGSRNTPEHICQLMTNAAGLLETMGLILRSGGAYGADQAFARGIQNQDNARIYLPWPSFNIVRETWPNAVSSASPAAFEFAARFFGKSWEHINPSTKRLMARNVHQLLGDDLKTPSLFVICWTDQGKAMGGTGVTIQMATELNIPVFNLGKQSPEEIGQHVSELIDQHSNPTLNPR